MKNKNLTSYRFAKMMINDDFCLNPNFKQKLLIRKYLLLLKENEKKIKKMDESKRLIATINNIPIDYYILKIHEHLIYNPNKAQEMLINESERIKNVNDSYNGNIQIYPKEKMISLLDGVADKDSMNRVIKTFYPETKMKVK